MNVEGVIRQSRLAYLRIAGWLVVRVAGCRGRGGLGSYSAHPFTFLVKGIFAKKTVLTFFHVGSQVNFV